MLILAATLWGIQPSLVKITINEIFPETLTTLRYFILSFILFIIMYFKGERLCLPPSSCLLALLFMGVTGILVNNVAQFSGLKYSTAINATLISTTTPSLTALLSALLLREKLPLLQWLGITLSFSGSLFLISQGNLAIIKNISFNIGDVLFLLSQISWALYALTSLRVMQKISILATTAWSGLFGAISTAIFAVATDTLHWQPLSLSASLSIGYIILCGGLISMLSWNAGVKKIGVSKAAIFTNLMPLVGMLTGFFLLGESITFLEIYGAMAILSGVYITTHTAILSASLKALWHRKT